MLVRSLTIVASVLLSIAFMAGVASSQLAKERAAKAQQPATTYLAACRTLFGPARCPTV